MMIMALLKPSMNLHSSAFISNSKRKKHSLRLCASAWKKS